MQPFLFNGSISFLIYMIDKKDFRIVFMGTPEFAVESLKVLLESGFNVVAVVTSPDKPAGRGQQLSQSAIKTFALEKNIQVLQPANLKDTNFFDQMKAFQADLNVIVAFRMLPEKIWNMPRLGSINLHGSLLPQYRGAAPINWAVINGEKVTGVTTFFLKHEIDTGDILFQKEIPIEASDDAGSVHDKLMIDGAKLLSKTVDVIWQGQYTEIQQSKLQASELKHAPKIFKEDCKINWNRELILIQNLVRGLSPYPAAWTYFENGAGQQIMCKIYRTKIEEVAHAHLNGTLLSDDKSYLKVAVADGFLFIEDIQISGKKRMSVSEFLNGFKEIKKYKAV